MDVFQPISGSYDLILSFNLLQESYFPRETIEAGISNLAASLNEGGLLIMGNTESFLALQKKGGSLIPRLREGSF
jgi:chemotaxis methyl-accepting protein methylase